MGVSKSMIIVVLVVVLATKYCSASYSGVQYSVGDSQWTIPPYPSYFSNWSSSHYFKIGDSLVFEFETGRYDVIQVSRLDYEMCTVWNPIRIYYGGPAIIPLTDPGVFYFICNFSNYCNLGLKISISVHRPTTPSPSPAPQIPPSPKAALLPPPPFLPPHEEAPPATGQKSDARVMRSSIGGGVFIGLLCLFPLFLFRVFV